MAGLHGITEHMMDALRSTLADQAYLSIKAKLAELDLMPGDRLSEKELADQLGISRTPVRQALQRLHHEGLLDLSPKLGWAVPQLNFDRLNELYDFRVVIEQYAAHCCATKPESLEKLRPLKAIWCVPTTERLTDPIEVGLLDERFHETLVAASGNREMVRAHGYITEHIRLIRRLDFIKPERVQATYHEHSNLLNLIFAGEVKEVSSALKAHILSSKHQSRAITLEAMFQRRQAHAVNAT
jgi:DNA-binding GntR family transcriptional regulator